MIEPKHHGDVSYMLLHRETLPGGVKLIPVDIEQEYTGTVRRHHLGNGKAESPGRRRSPRRLAPEH